jgi:Mn2+/Fe2+ NRAMP family transporter
MGALVNNRMKTVLASMVALLIVSLNIFLLARTAGF